MKLPLSWLAEFVTLEADVDELCRRLTLAGLEVENVERSTPGFSDVFVARVLKVERHPNADRLNLCEVDAGTLGRFSVVCGAPNVSGRDDGAVRAPGCAAYRQRPRQRRPSPG